MESVAVNGVHLALFVYQLQGDTTISRNIWEIVTGEKPDQRSENPKTNTFEDIGPFNGMMLNITRSQERIDFSLFPEDPNTRILLSAHDISSHLNLFLDRSREILANYVIIRFGLIIRFSEEMNSKEESYKDISEKLNINLDPSKASDFLYRVNYPSDYGGSSFNVISSWSTSLLMSHTFSFNGSPFSSSGKVRIFRNVDLDINTVPQDVKPKDIPLILNLTERFVSIAYEVYKKGPVSEYESLS